VGRWNSGEDVPGTERSHDWYDGLAGVVKQKVDVDSGAVESLHVGQTRKVPIISLGTRSKCGAFLNFRGSS
jgi:hypothetical protein